MLDWLVSTEITGVYRHAQYFMWMLVIDLRFPYMYEKQLYNRVIYPAFQLLASCLPITI